ncbi:MAG: PepSY-associated TM helix domain-containing protein [Prolixibacteraceae bacterium]
MNIRKTLRSLHRDFGYLVVGITFIYTISGIALNHRTDWNPHYTLVSEELTVPVSEKTDFNPEEIKSLLSKFDCQTVYKKHFTSRSGEIKIFVESGTVIYSPSEGLAVLEVLNRRPFFFQINKMHLAQTNRLWIWISDIMAIFLLFVALSGLFILKGKFGLKGRGLWLTATGVVIPLFVILFYLS